MIANQAEAAQNAKTGLNGGTARFTAIARVIDSGAANAHPAIFRRAAADISPVDTALNCVRIAEHDKLKSGKR